MSVLLTENVEKSVRTEDRQSTPTLESGRTSEENAWANEIRSRNAWGKNGRRVQNEAMARYIVEPCK